jgi:hypothetical protein
LCAGGQTLVIVSKGLRIDRGQHNAAKRGIREIDAPAYPEVHLAGNPPFLNCGNEGSFIALRAVHLKILAISRRSATSRRVVRNLHGAIGTYQINVVDDRFVKAQVIDKTLGFINRAGAQVKLADRTEQGINLIDDLSGEF